MRAVYLTALCLFLASAALASPPATPTPLAVSVSTQASVAAKFDVNDCKTCHETVFSNSFLHSKHAGLECASCQSCQPARPSTPRPAGGQGGLPAPPSRS